MAETCRLRTIIAQLVHNIGYHLKSDLSWTISSEESLDLLRDTHFPASSKNHTTEYTRDSGVVIDSFPIDIVS